MREVYIVGSGAYSDYSNHCAFEREEDAEAYLRAQGLVKRHYEWFGEDPTEPYPQPYYIEPLQFWPAGVVPVIES